MRSPKQFSKVTVVDNETGEETSGTVLIYTPRIIVLRDVEHFTGGGKLAVVTETRFDAQKVHFKGDE